MPKGLLRPVGGALDSSVSTCPRIDNRVTLTFPPSSGTTQEVRRIVRIRLDDRRLVDSIVGAVHTLDATQIRERPGQQSCSIDASTGDGCVSHDTWDWGGRDLPIPRFGADLKNKVGEWSTDFQMGPALLGSGAKGALPYGVLDPNVFVAAFVSYPLFLLDAAPGDGQAMVRNTRRLALESFREYERENGYAFWPTRADDPRMVGPVNIPDELLETMRRLYHDVPYAQLTRPLWKDLDPSLFEHLQAASKSIEGIGNFANIPPDADCTAVVVALQVLYKKHQDPTAPVNMAALEKLSDYRDIGLPDSPHTKWPGDTGAFATWLRSETDDPFDAISDGVVPWQGNAVDTVVNANAVFALALTGRQDAPGYKEAVDLLVAAIRRKHWEAPEVFYPAGMMFPYAVSRAYRDGGANEPKMRNAMKKLVGDILDHKKQNSPEIEDLDRRAFPPSFDGNASLSTALGLIALLNGGRSLAEEVGREREYDRVIADGIAYLQDQARPRSDGASGVSWEEGLFFMGESQYLTQWRSQAYTTAMALEALIKYALAYDLEGVSISKGRRLRLNQGAKANRSN